MAVEEQTSNPDRPVLLLISRHTMDDAFSGNSAYVRSLMAYLRASGYRIVLLIPSLRGLGRKPYARVSPDKSAFDAILLRGGVRLGGWVIRLEPEIWLRAAWIVLAKLLRLPGARRRASQRSWDIGGIDASELAAVGRAAAQFSPVAAMANYFPLCGALQAPALRHAAKIAIAHDVFYTRTEDFARLGLQMPHAPIAVEQEMAELAKADVVVAIQEGEAKIFREKLPGKRVLAAPAAMAVRESAIEPLPFAMAFVGSDNEVNRAGIAWFAREVWPRLTAIQPRATITIYGDVGLGMTGIPSGFVVAGRVDDLTGAYHKASLCIVPLLAGSGLKVKLIEALSHGRAVVTTSVGAQGVEDLSGQAFIVADSPKGFAEAAAAILDDDAARRRLQTAAITVVRDRFSAEACYGPLRDYIDSAASSHRAAPAQVSRPALDYAR